MDAVRKRDRKRAYGWALGVTAVILVGALAGALFLFQPWRLFTTTVVTETLPATPAPADTRQEPVEPEAPAVPVDLASGTFISHEHDTTGTARIVQQADGSRVLLIEGLATSDGPDLRIWLSDQPVIEGTDGWYVFDDGVSADLGALRGNVGDLVYPIPDEVDLSPFTSVSIWCARFAVSFGAATLTPA